jgi:hypothetical protein
MAASYLRVVAGQGGGLPRLQPVLSWPRVSEPPAEQSRSVGPLDRPRIADRGAGSPRAASASVTDLVRPAVAPTRSATQQLAPTAEQRAGATAPVATRTEATGDGPGEPQHDLATDVVMPPDPMRAATSGSLQAVTSRAAGPLAGPRSGAEAPEPRLRRTTAARPTAGGVTARRPPAAPPSDGDPGRRTPASPDGDLGLQVAATRAAQVPATAAPAIGPAPRNSGAAWAPDRPRRAGPGPAATGTIVRVGTIEVVVDRPAAPDVPPPPSAVMTGADASPASSLARGYRSTFGLRQG